jgi:serine/threonine-protein kinase
VGKEILSGQYRVLERIGSGGMGAVYKVQQPSMDRFVAVKILHSKFTNRKDLVSRFRREARAMSHLTHPNTAKVHLFGQLEDNACYIVMEYLEGKNLGQVVRQSGPLAPNRAFAVLIQACGALEEAHQKGIIHRDLKPENIFLCQMGGIKDFVKVLDFGLAKVTDREMQPGSLILTQEGMVFGTPEFMSPEQAQGKTLDPRSDVYSLAVILYELVTGKLPFDARTPMEYITLHVQNTPIPLARRAPDRQFPAGFQEVLTRAMAKNPEERYQSAAEFATALRDLADPNDPEIAQAMNAIPDNALAMAATQPARLAVKSDQPPVVPSERPPEDVSAPYRPLPAEPTPSARGPSGPPVGAHHPSGVGRPGLPVTALVAIGVLIGLAVALALLQVLK